MKRLATLVGLLAVGACAQGMQWRHPTATNAEAQQLGARCRYEAAQHSRTIGYGLAPEVDAAIRRNDMMSLCMQAAGFQYVRASDPTSEEARLGLRREGGSSGLAASDAPVSKPGGPLQPSEMGESRPNAPSTEELERRTAAIRAAGPQ